MQNAIYIEKALVVVHDPRAESFGGGAGRFKDLRTTYRKQIHNFFLHLLAMPRLNGLKTVRPSHITPGHHETMFHFTNQASLLLELGTSKERVALVERQVCCVCACGPGDILV